MVNRLFPVLPDVPSLFLSGIIITFLGHVQVAVTKQVTNTHTFHRHMYTQLLAHGQVVVDVMFSTSVADKNFSS